MPNDVIIRIWKYPKSSTNGNNVGHVSLETPNNYISFWPNERKGIGANFSVPGKFNSYNEDRLSEYGNLRNEGFFKHRSVVEGGKPTLEIKISGLDTNAIETEYKRIKSQNPNWGLLGSSVLGGSNTYNCSGIVAKLLLVGGIRKKINNNYASTFRRNGAIVAMFVFLYLCFSSGDYKNKTTEENIFAFSFFLLISTAVSGSLGGLLDAYDDVKILNNFLEKIFNITELNSSLMKNFMRMLVTMTGVAVQVTFSAITIDHASQWIATTPDHIEVIAKSTDKKITNFSNLT